MVDSATGEAQHPGGTANSTSRWQGHDDEEGGASSRGRWQQPRTQRQKKPKTLQQSQAIQLQVEPMTREMLIHKRDLFLKSLQMTNLTPDKSSLSGKIQNDEEGQNGDENVAVSGSGGGGNASERDIRNMSKN